MAINKILVPTDFSACSRNASEFAMALAAKLNAETHLLSRVHLHPHWHSLSDEEKQEFPESGFWEQIAMTEFTKLTEEFTEKNVPVNIAYGPGDIVPLVQNYVDENQIDLMVMGTHGLGGFNEWLFGSNAQKVVRKAACPSIVLKKLPAEVNFKRIVFATDYHPLSSKAMVFLKQWAALFDAEIHVVHVNIFMNKATTKERVGWKALAGDKGDVLIHEVNDISAEEGIREAAKRLGADMVAIANYPDHVLDRLLLGSVSEALINHLEIPVLSIPVELEK
ncbi:MAG: universal stress protein [Bacteroidia bacterium]|nr:universal stress protein [Bacteroidia bacterium]